MNPQKCRNHTLNNSNTKYTYKFGSQQRFKNTQRLYTHSMYTINPTKQMRSTGFGYGQRTKLQSSNSSPSPNQYIIPSSLKRFGKSFGMGRRNVKFRNFMEKAEKSDQIPSPNQYQSISSIKKKSISFGYKLPTYIDMCTKKKSPAPNSYNLDKVSVNLDGKYPNSKMKNVPHIVFLGRQSFYEPAKESNVGPGSYQIRYKTESSHNFRCHIRTFGSAQRPSPADKSKKYNPGPGMYQTFSEFAAEKNL